MNQHEKTILYLSSIAGDNLGIGGDTFMSEAPPVNDNQRIDLEKLKALVTTAKTALPHLEELIDLAQETELLQEVQRARENMIVEQMASDAGLLKPEDPDGEEADDTGV